MLVVHNLYMYTSKERVNLHPKVYEQLDPLNQRCGLTNTEPHKIITVSKTQYKGFLNTLRLNLGPIKSFLWYLLRRLHDRRRFIIVSTFTVETVQSLR